MIRTNMLKLAKYLEDNVKFTDFNMCHYTSFNVNPEKTEHPCRTSACIAGWAWIQNHQDIVDEAYSVALQEDISDEDKDKWGVVGLGKIRTVYPSSKLKGGIYSLPGSPEKIFATLYLGLSSEESDQLFTCTVTNRTGQTIWDKYVEELGLDTACDCGEGCRYDDEIHPVSLDMIGLDHAITMLTKLGHNEWSFDPAF